MKYQKLYQLTIYEIDFKNVEQVSKLLTILENMDFNVDKQIGYIVTSTKPFTTKQVELISEYVNIPEEIKNTLSHPPVIKHILAKYNIESNAKLVSHKFGTKGVDCWFDFYDEDGIEYRSHRCLTFESFELFQKFKTE